jgi:hypothetical protein
MSDKSKRASRSFTEEAVVETDDGSGSSERTKRSGTALVAKEKKDKDKEKDKEPKSRPVRASTSKVEKREPKRDTLRKKKKGSGIFPSGVEGGSSPGSPPQSSAIGSTVSVNVADDSELDSIQPDVELHKQAEIRFTSDLCEAYSNITSKAREYPLALLPFHFFVNLCTCVARIRT